MKLSTLLHWVEEGDSNNVAEFVKSYLNDDYNLLFNLLEKNNLIDKEEVVGFFQEDMPTQWLNYMYGVDPQYVIDYITDEYFGDVKQEGNKSWLSISREDLADLFDESRWGDGSRGVAKKVLSDDFVDFFDFVGINDLNDDVVEELTPENLESLKKRVYQEIEGEEIEIDGETDIVTLDMVMDMDESELSELIKDNAPDVNSNLASLYNSAYEYAYSDEVYEDVMNELKSFFGVNDFSREVPYKRKTYKKGTNEPIEVDDYMYQVDVTNILPKVIKTVLSYGGYNSDNDFEYYGSFEGLLKFYVGEEGYLNFTVNDYADWSKVNENINSLFNDYI